MVPLVILVLVGVVLVVAVLGVASGRLPGGPPRGCRAHHSRHRASLPAPVAADVDAVRFDTALRGYRMEDVDDRLEALRDDLAERERVLAELGVARCRHARSARADPPDPRRVTAWRSPSAAPPRSRRRPPGRR